MNYATIGTGWITEAFIQASREVNDFQLHAVYSRSEEKAKSFAEKHHAKDFFTDLEEMAACTNFDCVYIASPNSLHYKHAITFLKHGKHVICEKPIFSNTEELNEAYQVAEANNVYLFEAIRSIYSPNFQSLKASLGKVGTVRSCILHRGRYSSQYDNYLDGKNPNVFSLEFSGGALMDMGVYPLYLAVALFGKPDSVSYKPVILESGVDGSGTLVLTYDGFICTVMCSKITTSYIPCEIHGETGTLTFENAAQINNLAYIDRKAKQTTPIETNAVDQDMVYEIEAFAEIVRTNDVQSYKELKELSCEVLSVTEEARRQNGIVFESER
ncbi:Gfo/Idh/MocA family protein [Virgibacillus doumboii]|uniref:Gfo/Idh/MocA family protein n=1 Tax=Virgibacillus doumboii TaxID=2697503 RepID=UPI0013DE8A7A|nr:Gfo/Idh/MocA family oxidoreductase [Virgibacillus doumboii]